MSTRMRTCCGDRQSLAGSFASQAETPVSLPSPSSLPSKSVRLSPHSAYKFLCSPKPPPQHPLRVRPIPLHAPRPVPTPS
eukprot:1329222-Rhodomonas_salina.1